MRLVADWRWVLRRAWSVRLIILTAILTGAEVAFAALTALAVVPTFMPAGVFAALAGVTSAAAFFARLYAQSKDNDDG